MYLTPFDEILRRAIVSDILDSVEGVIDGTVEELIRACSETLCSSCQEKVYFNVHFILQPTTSVLCSPKATGSS